MKSIFTTLTIFLLVITACAKIQITASEGWLETAFVEWQNAPDAKSYNVYVAADGKEWTRIDNHLVRNYGTYGRADAPGLKAGSYRLRVVPVDNNGSEVTADANETPLLTVAAHDRTGYAHKDRPTAGTFEGVGAYRNDGTLKDGAIVLYVTANNAKTMSLELQYTSTSRKTYTGLNTIIEGYRKCWAQGTKQPPLCIRIIGLLKAENMDKVSGKGINIKGEQRYTELPMTIEGIGNDATIHGLGIGVSQVCGAELRNLAIMLCPDDAIEVATYNSHVWIHHNDIFYGKTGSDADQVKGDGSIDIKQSQYCTVAYNHFFDCGKCSLLDAGAKSVDYVDNLTYHHNWFDHSDQRNPRCRNGHAFHIYNNYYDGNALYGVGMACGSSAFVEANYFRNCKFPVLASAQGSDKQWLTEKKIDNPELVNKGFLSGENGGIAKWYANEVHYANSLYTQFDAIDRYSFDVYEVLSRDEQVPATVKTLKDKTPYSNFDTDATDFYPCTPDAAADVPAIVTGPLGAGRLQKGDFVWQFDNAKEDESEELIAALKQDMTDYRSTLVGFYGETIKNGGGNGNSGGDADKNADYIPSYIEHDGINTININSSANTHNTPAAYNVAGQQITPRKAKVYKAGGKIMW